MKTQLIFIIQAYQSATDTGQLTDNVTIELIDKDCKSALKRAEFLIKKPFYRISNIIEKEEK